MSMLNISNDEILRVVLQLEQAIYNHNHWYESLLRTLICHLPHDRRDVEQDAHLKCRFGQWYNNYAPPEIRSHPSFIAIEAEHERMHRLAASLLMAESTGGTISLLDYENFNNSISNVRIQLQTLKYELEDLLYNHDPLTRAYSRIGMLTKLRELQQLVKRNVYSCCIAMMDLDHFKSINDVHGHQVGDQVLSAVAGNIMGGMRPYDKLFRYGGEEFLISLPNSNSKFGLNLVERFRKEIAANSIVYEGRDVRITASFGLTLLDPDIAVEESINRADKALYAAKSSGRNCARIWDTSLDT